MAVHAQNISMQYLNRHAEEPLPLIDGVDDEPGMSEIPDTDEKTEGNKDGK